jgi:pilus assembly protein Flp/PilA
MKNIKEKLVEFYCDEEGASAIEYALIAAMVAVALVTFVTPIRDAVTAIFTSISNSLTNATPSDGG